MYTDGKSKLSVGPAIFNKVASEWYRMLTSEERESLREKVKAESSKEVKMTKQEERF